MMEYVVIVHIKAPSALYAGDVVKDALDEQRDMDIDDSNCEYEIGNTEVMGISAYNILTKQRYNK